MENTLRTLLTPSALLACLFIGTTTLSADHMCADCHNSESPGTNDLNKPLSVLCVDCHAARIAAGEHKVDIAVNILGKAPGSVLPLQDDRLTCITCHDPHKASLALRIPANELCEQCHKR